jgi:hypothetical protein
MKQKWVSNILFLKLISSFFLWSFRNELRVALRFCAVESNLPLTLSQFILSKSIFFNSQSNALIKACTDEFVCFVSAVLDKAEENTGAPAAATVETATVGAVEVKGGGAREDGVSNPKSSQTVSPTTASLPWLPVF